MASMKKMVNDIDRTLDSVGNGYRLCILGGLNRMDRR